jgi:hypothetical protein
VAPRLRSSLAAKGNTVYSGRKHMHTLVYENQIKGRRSNRIFPYANVKTHFMCYWEGVLFRFAVISPFIGLGMNSELTYKGQYRSLYKTECNGEMTLSGRVWCKFSVEPRGAPLDGTASKRWMDSARRDGVDNYVWDVANNIFIHYYCLMADDHRSTHFRVGISMTTYVSLQVFMSVTVLNAFPNVHFFNRPWAHWPPSW